jgi:hypothetical protein
MGGVCQSSPVSVGNAAAIAAPSGAGIPFASLCPARPNGIGFGYRSNLRTYAFSLSANKQTTGRLAHHQGQYAAPRGPSGRRVAHLGCPSSRRTRPTTMEEVMPGVSAHQKAQQARSPAKGASHAGPAPTHTLPAARFQSRQQRLIPSGCTVQPAASWCPPPPSRSATPSTRYTGSRRSQAP